MGMFLSMSAIVNGELSEVEGLLKRFAASHGGKMEPAERSESQETAILGSGRNGISIVYPGDFFDWDGASKFLSEETGKPVFSLHIHDGDLWMFLLFRSGEIVDRFNPVPDYWEELDEDERASWSGDAVKVAEAVPGTPAAAVSKYLIPWGDEILESETRQKAYADDEFFYGDDWQLVDFMKRLGLVYPIDDKGIVSGKTFRFEVRSPETS